MYRAYIVLLCMTSYSYVFHEFIARNIRAPIAPIQGGLLRGSFVVNIVCQFVDINIYPPPPPPGNH